MEILLVLIVLAVVAAAAFLLMRSRDGTPLRRGRREKGPALRGRRRSRAATRHDPMADAVERHAIATDPREAAEAELRLQAQANRVASDLHAQQASELESHAGGRGRVGGDAASTPASSYGQPAYDAAARRGHVDGQPVNGVERPPYGGADPVYEDEQGRPVHEGGRPVDEDGGRRLPEQDGGPAYYDEQGRPVYPEDRPRY